jgi:glyoxylase-like metal-dependent hydrolase (beta-lactamase superfamily II)
VPESEAEALWELSGDMEAIAVPGDRWPSRVSMELEEIAAGVYMVHGVRTGFSHLVIDTEKGLVVADAPAGWVEIHQVPPTDLVPGLGVSGLSEKFMEFLAERFPNRPIRAVAITHAHDDHAGGARAFAAAGARIYAPAEVAEFLQTSLNDWSLPKDRFSLQSRRLEIVPVDSRVVLADPVNPVEITAIPTNPHVSAALGVWAQAAGVFFQSDLHVPASDQPEPRADRALTECWFARWAVSVLPAETIVLNSHSNPATPVSRLAEYLETPLCQDLAR